MADKVHTCTSPFAAVHVGKVLRLDIPLACIHDKKIVRYDPGFYLVWDGKIHLVDKDPSFLSYSSVDYLNLSEDIRRNGDSS